MSNDFSVLLLDIDEVAVVVNYDLPKDINDYVQRIGRARTACTGDMGIAYSFYDVTQDQELNSDLVFALKSVNQPVPEFLMDEASDDKELAREFKNENEDFILRMKVRIDNGIYNCMMEHVIIGIIYVVESTFLMVIAGQVFHMILLTFFYFVCFRNSK